MHAGKHDATCIRNQQTVRLVSRVSLSTLLCLALMSDAADQPGWPCAMRLQVRVRFYPEL
eukprot:2474657-Amphidinium_carterae.2